MKQQDETKLDGKVEDRRKRLFVIKNEKHAKNC